MYYISIYNEICYVNIKSHEIYSTQFDHMRRAIQLDFRTNH